MRLIAVFILTSLLALTGCNTTPLPDACYQKAESGRCRAAKTRYYFDDRENRCKAFIWGGCEGSVPFDTAQQCFQQCGGDVPTEDKPVKESLQHE